MTNAGMDKLQTKVTGQKSENLHTVTPGNPDRHCI